MKTKTRMDDAWFTRLNAVIEQLGGVAKAAVIAGVGKSQLYRYLRDEATPGLAPVIRLAEAAEVSLDWLLRGAADGEESEDGEAASIDRLIRAKIPANAAFFTAPSDQMAPRIRKGDVIAVIPGGSGNGIYWIAFEGASDLYRVTFGPSVMVTTAEAGAPPIEMSREDFSALKKAKCVYVGQFLV